MKKAILSIVVFGFVGLVCGSAREIVRNVSLEEMTAKCTKKIL